MIGWQAIYAVARKSEQKKDWNQAISLYETIIKTNRKPDARVLYRLGNAQFTLGNISDAEKNVGRAIEIDPTVPTWHYRLGFIHEKNKKYSSAIESYSKAINLDSSVEQWHKRVQSCLNNLDSSTQTSASNSHAASSHQFTINELYRIFIDDPKNTVVADTLASRFSASGKRWQEIEVLERHLPYQVDDNDWNFRLARAYAAMNRYAEAGQHFNISNALMPNVASRYFQEGSAWIHAHELKKAQSAFNLAIKHDNKLKSRQFGIGSFYQNIGDWASAAKEYNSSLESNPSSAELHYRLGLALERCYDWNNAATRYSVAIQLDPLQWNWHYRRGFTMERLERWSEAADCYRFAAEGNANHVPDWFYRLGFSLNQNGEFRSACEAFMDMRPNTPLPNILDATDTPLEPLSAYGKRSLIDAFSASHTTESLVRVSEYAEKHGAWDISVISLNKASQQNDNHDADTLFSLGRALYACGRYEEAAVAFMQMRIFPTAHGIETKKYQKDKNLFSIMQYTSWTENLPLDENVIFYETFHSDSIGCNPLAMYLDIRKNPQYSHLRHVWSVNDSTVIPREVAEDPRTITIRRNSDAYQRYLATAKYLISNVTFHSWFVRRNGQKYLNTWHGTPIKTLGKDIQSGFLEHKNVARNFLQATHVISGNSHTTEILTNKYDIGHIWTAKVAETGYPRVDQTLNITEDRKRRIFSMLRLTDEDRQRPTILYAPTWRGGLDTRHFDIERLTGDLQRLHTLNANILFQAHHYTEQLLEELDVPVITVPKGINSNELLAVVDILVTDYSSIAFDFLAQGRPLFFYTYDLEEFAAERGLYFDSSELPGPALSTIETLMHAIKCSLDGSSDYDASNAKAKFCSKDDGDATTRAIDFFLNDDETCIVATLNSSQKSLLFHHSFIPNGITTSAQNLLASLNSDEYKPTIIVPAEDTAADPLRIAKIRELPDQVSIVGRTGRQLFTPEEKWIVDNLNRNRTLSNPEQWGVYNRSFAREYRRIFGASNFDAVIEFEGYSTFWASILAGAPSDSTKSIYLHNDMMSEWQKRFQYLESMFRIYDSYDRLVSVSPSISDENERQLSGMFKLDSEKFIGCINQISPQAIMSRATDSLDEDINQFMRVDAFQLVTIGRLSPEKDHAKLINALAKVRKILSPDIDIQLTILGDGPLRSDLSRQIEDLELQDCVLLAGLRHNPFPSLNRSDAFVLSSNHEGQPMVLLEALILGKKILSTDIIGTRYVLRDSPQCLVENSVAGLVEGLLTLVSEEFEQPRFDSQDYVAEASERFLNAVLRNNDSDSIYS